LDWNRTKTIFIIVFAILNVFLYTLYVNRISDARELETLTAPNVNIEEKLEQDHITLKSLPPKVNELGYVSGKLKVFTQKEIESLPDQTATISDDTRLLSTLKNAYELTDIKKADSYKEFLDTFVLSGNQFTLWNVNEKEGKAEFLQVVEERPIYYTQPLLIVYFNKDHEIVRYEQRMFENFEEFNTTKNIVQPTTALNTIYTREMLPPDSVISSMDLGYSTLVQLTETQVFAPTWHIHVELTDGQTNDFFVNAVEGKIIELQHEDQDGKE